MFKNILMIGLTLLAGFLSPLQMGMNSTLGKYLQHPLWAALWNSSLAILIFLMAIIALKVPIPSIGLIGSSPLWSFFGGVIGALFILVGILFAPKLGAVLFMALVIAATFTMSVILDHFGLAGYPIKPITFWRVIGLIVMYLGVLIIQKG